MKGERSMTKYDYLVVGAGFIRCHLCLRKQLSVAKKVKVIEKA